MVSNAETEPANGERPNRVAAVLRALRPAQWAKNFLLFVPPFLAHETLSAPRLLDVVLAFAGLSLAASSVYVLNDLLDLRADRAHPLKRRRPFASGALPVAVAPPLAAVLATAGTALAFLVSGTVAALVATYVALNLLYSFALKRLPLVDVFVLAGFYALRLIVGGAAAEVEVSRWLLAFSIFLFLSLAFAKRYAELTRLRRESESHAVARGYRVGDLDLLAVVGPCSGYLAVLVLALYVNSRDVVPLYDTPDLLWSICALLLYWVTRLWLLAHREALDEDPVVFVLRDPTSLAVAAASAVIVVLAAS